MEQIELLTILSNHAKEYRKEANDSMQRNAHMFKKHAGIIVHQDVIDAILVDFINTLAASNGVDYGMYTHDLKTNG